MEENQIIDNSPPTFGPRLELIRFKWERGSDVRELKFLPGLNILHGANQADRTIALRLIHYALGGNSKRIDNEDLLKTSGVKLRFRIDKELVDVSRKCRETQNLIEVSEHSYRPVLRYNVSPNSLSRFLLDKLNFPIVEMSRVQRGKAVSVPLSFNDIYRAIFVDRDMSYASVMSGAFDMTRREVVKILIGLTTREIAEKENRRLQLDGEKKELEQRIANIKRFLSELAILTVDEIKTKSNELLKQIDAIDGEEAELRRQVREMADSPETSGEYSRFRDDFIALREKVNNNRAEVLNLTNYEKEKIELRTELEGDLQRLVRQVSAKHVISTFSFATCPRCLQAIEDEMKAREDHNDCMLCGRHFASGEDNAASWNKAIRDAQQAVKELNELIGNYQTRKESIHLDLGRDERQLSWLEKQLEVGTKQYVSPLVEQIKLSSIRRTELEKELSQLDYQLKTREHARFLEEEQLPDDIRRLEGLTRELQQLRGSLGSEADRYTAMVKSYKHFLDHVEHTRRVDLVAWNAEEQLPIVDDQPLEKAFSGPDLAVAVLGFHYALLAASVENPILRANHPRVLIVDEPKQQNMSPLRYRQIMKLFSGLAKRFADDLQIVIATDDRTILNQFEHCVIEL